MDSICTVIEATFAEKGYVLNNGDRARFRELVDTTVTNIIKSSVSIVAATIIDCMKAENGMFVAAAPAPAPSPAPAPAVAPVAQVEHKPSKKPKKDLSESSAPAIVAAAAAAAALPPPPPVKESKKRKAAAVVMPATEDSDVVVASAAAAVTSDDLGQQVKKKKAKSNTSSSTNQLPSWLISSSSAVAAAPEPAVVAPAVPPPLPPSVSVVAAVDADDDDFFENNPICMDGSDSGNSEFVHELDESLRAAILSEGFGEDVFQDGDSGGTEENDVIGLVNLRGYQPIVIGDKTYRRNVDTNVLIEACADADGQPKVDAEGRPLYYNRGKYNPATGGIDKISL